MHGHRDSTACRDWVAAVVAGHDPREPLQGCPATDIVDVAVEEQVATLLANAIAALPWQEVPADLPELLERHVRADAMRELALQAQARQAIVALSHDGGMQVLVLKGAALAYWLYADPAQRPRSDLDLLVADRDIAAIAVSRLAPAGYAPMAGVGIAATPEAEVTLLRQSATGSHAIDLHWQLLNHAALGRAFGFGELWSHSIPVPALHPRARGLGRVHALAHALLHRVTNMPTGQQDRLGWLYDIHLLAGGCTEVDWNAFLCACGEKGIATPCLDGLEASRGAYATNIPADVEHRLRLLSAQESWILQALDQGAMDRAHFAALPWRAKAGWLRRKLFPSRDFMRHRYGAQHGAMLVRAYAARWWQGVRRGLGGE